ncbi:MAG: 7-cyano-7-deazaguanine/7-aminomethyl-7-deazaguanine transporter [Saprospiraceae bacterium]|nr:MAG: Inner membrane protein YhhQ [Bacteroidetes bacterium OLB9]MCO6462821.1 7-cyano-7-deazaguanine/7-aminomethyl-7-deazaguanine transporter [Saprospiraceae bacterium]MCZ2336743.1 7-cyano-7-deazaguanine/7-aminomethyl-7-deazaguanine transporter [Chitinophagales bacterium]
MEYSRHNASIRLAILLAGFHVLIIAASNYLVQLPVTVLGFHATWGAFVFPFIFLTTDLTVRIFGALQAKRIVFYAMVPALIVSYVITVLFRDAQWTGIESLGHFNLFVFRIAMASLSAYVVGQIMDIFVFNKLRQHEVWWYAPLASAIVGNLVDTFTFFTIAFYKTSDTYLAEHLVEIAIVDYAFKIIINSVLFLPMYKVVLDRVKNV